MKLLILNGSPKSGRSNTMNITRAFIDGFPKDTEVEQIDLYKKEIRPCLGCFSCWSKTPGECVIKDDMQKIYEKIKASDIIIESFPLYFFGMPSVMKCLTDRCLPFMLLYMGNQTGEGWFLTGEMIELIESGAPNIVCMQPFGCLPNHVTGKGAIKALRKKYPQSNIVAVDYDPGASEVNQLNRIKLMLSTAQKNLNKKQTI